ncbi:MAG: hypothetical protein ACAI44_23660 [Candidatus Sericytochromatia bacterium]
MSQEQGSEASTEEKPRRGIQLTRMQLVLGGLLIVVLALVAGLGSFQVMKFKAKAEGLALGYAEAAVTAYQMDRYARPMPDRIFELDHYRVETRTHGTPPQLHINVRDRYLNLTHFELDRQFDVSGRPAPPPNEGQER